MKVLGWVPALNMHPPHPTPRPQHPLVDFKSLAWLKSKFVLLLCEMCFAE